jgi:hypothetical protein
MMTSWDHEELKEKPMAKWDTDGIQQALDGAIGGAYCTDPQEDEKVPQDKINFDNVNSPKHYGQGDIECIDYIADFLSYDEYVGYLRGNIAKYLHRWRHKGGLEDLKKAQWYLNKLVQEVEYEETLSNYTGFV